LLRDIFEKKFILGLESLIKHRESGIWEDSRQWDFQYFWCEECRRAGNWHKLLWGAVYNEWLTFWWMLVFTFKFLTYSIKCVSAWTQTSRISSSCTIKRVIVHNNDKCHNPQYCLLLSWSHYLLDLSHTDSIHCNRLQVWLYWYFWISDLNKLRFT